MILDLETPDFRSLLHTLKIEVILFGLWRVVGFFYLFIFFEQETEGKAAFNDWTEVGSKADISGCNLV